MERELCENEQLLLLAAARDAIMARLERRPPARSDRLREIDERCGVFVSLHIGKELRGCIGRMSSGGLPLYECVQEMAVAAAFEDPRFPPLRAYELPRVAIEISVLAPLESVAQIGEIIIGKHGLYVRKGAFSGVLLPQVASEQHWDVESFLAFTCRKAGLEADAWHDPATELFRFAAIVFSERSGHEER